MIVHLVHDRVKEDADRSLGYESDSKYLRKIVLKSWHLRNKFIWLTSKIMTSDTRLNIHKSLRLKVENIWYGWEKTKDFLKT